MAAIGERIRQVLRILHTDGQSTARHVYERMAPTPKHREESTKYLARAAKHGFAQRIETTPASYVITPAGIDLIVARRDAVWRRPPVSRTMPSKRIPVSVWDLARTLSQ